MRKPRLMTPGPAKVPEDVLLELARPVIHHRSAEAKQVITEVTDGLKEVFQTQNDVLILTASGTGRDGGRGGQHGASGRQGAGLERGLLRGALGQYLQGVRHQRGDRSRPSGGSRSTPIRSPRRCGSIPTRSA